LFNESILSNISYGHPEAKIEEVENITKSVNIYNNIKSLDEGFSTNVGTMGSKLSGGEKQRILLARTFLKQSEIVLLDEPTSSLDSYNENLVLDYLSKNKTNKTILISSHK
jgi:ATP-binding cassette subfamily C protein